MAKLTNKLKHAWNAFKDEETPESRDPFQSLAQYGASYGIRPSRGRLNILGDKSIVGSIYTRISIDAAAVEVHHVKLDDQDRLSEHANSKMDNCLNLDSNIDQTSSAFKQDIFMSLFEDGIIAIVPVDTTLSPKVTGGYDITSMRVGKIVEWYPEKVKVNVYNERNGKREDVVLDKKFVAIVENPFYSVMNEPNSTLQRLIRKLALLDAVDEQSSSGKLDLIIQLPYVIKSEARKQQAEQRRKDIEVQLKGSQYGIAYTDGTERITQLNRPAENNLWKQVQDLTDMLYAHLGLTPEVMNGTANEATMLNYNQRTIKPLLRAVTEAMERSFLTQTARTQGHAIRFYTDPFQLIPIGSIAEIADKFTRNEIMTANEIRGVVGMKPFADPKADKLQNSNMPVAKQEPSASDPPTNPDPTAEKEEAIQDEA